MSELTNIKTGMLKVLIANVVNLIIGLLSSFILPKFLSINSYAEIKTFQLYVSYIGLLHFGYVDALYLLYGGQEINKIDKDSLKENLSTFQVFQVIVTIISIGIGVVLKNNLMLAFSISIIPSNMLSFYQCIYQASGEFALYGKIINSTTVSYFILNMILIFFLHQDNPYLYIGVIIVVNYCVCMILMRNAWKKQKIRFEIKSVNLKLILYNVKNGISLTLGNLSSIFLTGMDRWFVKTLMNNIAFAQYSFAVSIENFLEVLTSSVTITMYNFFCRVIDLQKIREARNMVMFLATCIVACAFPARWVLENFLTKYIESIHVMFLLFGAQIFNIVIKGIYINLYKVQKKQNIYFIKLIGVIIIGFTFNIVCYKIWPIKECFAIGTLLSAICWYFMSVYDFKYIKYNIKELSYPFVQVCIYLICGLCFKAILGFAIYIFMTLMITYFLLPDTINKALNFICVKIKK